MWNTALVMAAGLLRSNRPLSMISLRDEDHVAQHREHVFLDAADHLAVDEGLARRVLHLQLDAPGLAHQLHLEVLVTVEDFLGVVALAAGVQHGQRALAEQRVEAAGARIEQLFDLGLGEILEAAARSDARIHEVGNDDAGFQESPRFSSPCCGDRVYSTAGTAAQGWMSIGTLSDVIIQISTMSALVTAMQPSVQSCVA